METNRKPAKEWRPRTLADRMKEAPGQARARLHGVEAVKRKGPGTGAGPAARMARAALPVPDPDDPEAYLRAIYQADSAAAQDDEDDDPEHTRVRCPRCGRETWAWILVDVSGVDETVRGPHTWACDACTAAWSLSDTLDEDELVAAMGAPDEVVEAVRKRRGKPPRNAPSPPGKKP